MPTESPIGEFQIDQILGLDFERIDWQQQGDTVKGNTLTSQHLSGCAFVATTGDEFPFILPETKYYLAPKH